MQLGPGLTSAVHDAERAVLEAQAATASVQAMRTDVDKGNKKVS